MENQHNKDKYYSIEQTYLEILEVQISLRNTHISIATILNRFDEAQITAEENLVKYLKEETEIMHQEIERLSLILNKQREIMYSLK